MSTEDDPELAPTVPSPDSDRAAVMAAETRTVAGGTKAPEPAGLPTSIDRYQIVGRIGEGGMGVVYEATDPDLKRRVAVKVVRGRAGLVREAQAMAQLSHPSVVPVFDVGALAEGDGVFIAMELVEGETLRDWLKAAKRPWKQVVAKLVAAGRGLAAAHAAGIVHRDFKPANVLVGMDGRVRVTDFGLARVDDSLDGDGGAAAKTGETGIAGTPGYVAPEALDGVIDAKVDQFAFCVSFYEALYGERPFDAGSGTGRSPLVAMAEEAKRTGVKAAPRGRDVPGWLRAMIVRGLDADPAKRWPSVTALLDAIERVPRRRRWWIGAALTTVALLGTVVVVATQTTSGAVACSTAGQRVDRLLGAQDRGVIGRRFAELRTFGAVAASDAFRRIDSYAARWKDVRIDACRATHERGEQSSAVLDQRMRCLDRELDDLARLLSALGDPSPMLVDHASELVAGLSDPESCSFERATQSAPLPNDARVAEFSRLVAETKVLRESGRMEEGKETITRALSLAETIGHRGLIAESRSMLAAYVRETNPVEAQQMLERALEDAVAAEDPLMEVSIVTSMLQQATKRGANAQVESLLPIARATLARVGEAPHVLLRFDEIEAFALLQLGQVDAATAVCDRHEQRSFAEPAQAAKCRCAVLARAGRYGDSAVHCRTMLDLFERTLGADHPQLSTHLRNLAVVERNLGDHERSLALRVRALQIEEANWGPESLSVGTAAHAVALQLVELGRLEEALVLEERAIEIGKQDPRPSSGVVERLSTYADLLVKLGRVDEGLKRGAEATQMAEALYGEDSQNFIIILMSEMFAMAGAERHRDTLRLAERASRLAEKVLGPTHQWLGLISFARAHSLIETGRAAEALAFAERAVSILDAASADTDPINVAESHFILGDALARLGRFREARAEVRRAQTLIEPLGDVANEQRAKFAKKLASWGE